MPCDTISTVSLELKNANIDWLKKAVNSLGYPVYSENEYGIRWGKGEYNSRTGELVSSDAEHIQKVKRAYSAELVRAKASRFGWRVKEISRNKFQIQKG